MYKGIPLMGRGPDGKAKIINVDENGNVKVQQSAIVLDRLEQIERALLISAGLRHEYYIDGMEYAPGGWVEGITKGPEDWWERYKAEDHMYFFAQRNPDGLIDVSYVTKEKVDLTNVRFVYVELEAEVLSRRADSSSPNLYLVASTDSEGTYNDFEARSTIYGNRDGSSEGRVIRGLNVTGLTGEYYLRLHSVTTSVTGQAFDLETKIFRVWGEGAQKVQLSGNMAASGLHANRPDANAVPPGFIYYSVDLEENKLSYSDGTSWVVMS